jgi:hypothetical protein
MNQQGRGNMGRKPAGLRVKAGAPSGDNEGRLYSEAVSNKIFTKKFEQSNRTTTYHLTPLRIF